MVLVDSDACDVGAGEPGYLARGPADAAADVKDVHPGPYADGMCEVVLVSSDGGGEGLSRAEAAEVEGLGPAVLVEIGCEVVVLPGQGRILFCSGLSIVESCKY